MSESGKRITFCREDSYFERCMLPNNLVLESYLNNFILQNPSSFTEVFCLFVFCFGNKKLSIHDGEKKRKIFGRGNHTITE